MNAGVGRHPSTGVESVAFVSVSTTGKLANLVEGRAILIGPDARVAGVETSGCVSCADLRCGQRIKPETLYERHVRFSESWKVGLEGGWEQLSFLADGR